MTGQNDELELLLEQKRELEQKIAEIRHGEITCGRAKFLRERYYGHHKDAFQIRIQKSTFKNGCSRRLDKYFSVIESWDKVDLVPQIEQIINDLSELCERLKKDGIV